MNMSSLQDDESEEFNGISTKWGRRQRQITDKLSNSARIRHSYLKIVIEDHVFDQLHKLVCQIEHKWRNTMNIDVNQQQTVSKKQSKRQLIIKPRSRNSLHMTYFFAGQVLKDMTSEELLRWEYCVRKCVLEHNSESMQNDYSLRFKSLMLFPPNRQNLIVAVFESSATLNDLYDKLCDVAVMKKEKSHENIATGGAVIGSASDGARQDNEFPMLTDLTRKLQQQRSQQKSPCWIAHVTLGNLTGGKKEDVHRLSKWLNTVQRLGGDAINAKNERLASTSEISPHPNVLSLTDINVIGLALGGPVPEHVTIDWNFPFKS